MTVTVYSKPDCVQCNYTKVHLDRNKVHYNVIDVTQDGEALKMLQDKGLIPGTMPVVKVDHGKQIEWWQGFKIEKIRGLNANS
jgi:glutaredoxin-like protein NrdH